MDRAVAWYEFIIEYDLTNSDKALFTLAEIYFNGDGVERNIDKAIELYERAADNDNLKAIYKLAKIYRDGTALTKTLTRHKSSWTKPSTACLKKLRSDFFD